MSSFPEARLVTTRDEWRAHLAALPEAHLLQSWEWGEFKSRHSWTAKRLVWERDGQMFAAAQILRRQAPLSGLPLPFPSSILYIPKGPLLNWHNLPLRAHILSAIEDEARRQRAIFVKIDPDVMIGRGISGTDSDRPDPLGAEIVTDLRQRGWRPGSPVQFRNTVLLDLRRSEADLLAAMKQKTRYNIRLAEKKGVRVRPGDQADLDLLYRLYAETSRRDGFVIRSPDYYREAWGEFMATGIAQPFIAEVEGAAVAAIVVLRFGRVATYMYGMSRAEHREKMPNHLLQWEAMRWAQAHGCAVYDFWGAPDSFDEADRLWGVWRFKEGFGGEVVRTIGAWDYPISRFWYWIYTGLVPRYLDVMRRRGKRRTAQALEEM